MELNGILLVIGGFILLFIIISVLVGIYNGLIGSSNGIKESHARIDSLLEKRYDLSPNLIETVNKYMKHETELLKDITSLRENSKTDDNIQQLNKIEDAAKTFMIKAENYPDLKADSLFINLQNEVAMIEKENDSARRLMNHAVVEYNNKIEMFPSNIIAGMFNFKVEEMFKAEEKKKKNIDFSSLLK